MRTTSYRTLAAALLLLLGTSAFGEVLDRIVAVIDDKFIITLSDVRKERAIQSALGSNAGADDEIIEALIERYLVEDQISQFLEIDVQENEVAERLRSMGDAPGVSRQDLREALVGQLRRRQFMIERFQQFIRVSDEEVEEYYNDVYVPEARRRGERVLPLTEVAEQIRQNKAAEKTNDEVGSWLTELKRRVKIEKIAK
jgi:hypothetical protein